MSEIKEAPGTSSVLRPSMLRPSKFLSSGTETTNTAEGKAVSENEKLTQNVNPFLKEYQLEDETENGASSSNNEKTNTEKTPSDPLSLLSKPNFSKIKLFTSTNSSQSQDSGFIFGQNVHERVVGENIQQQKETSTSSKSNSNDSGLLFTDAVQNKTSSENGKEKATENKSLTEIAREYEESRAQKRKYEEVKTITGEENEDNVAEIDCKLFAFENGNYEERSRGILRLNDSREKENLHRVVFRTFGTLRLLVNTKVWPDMIVESPSPKSLRFTAMDNNGHIKIFLAMSRPDYISSMFVALKSRVAKLKNVKVSPNENLCLSEQNAEFAEKDETETFSDSDNKTENIVETTLDKANENEMEKEDKTETKVDSDDSAEPPTNKKIHSE